MDDGFPPCSAANTPSSYPTQETSDFSEQDDRRRLRLGFVSHEGRKSKGCCTIAEEKHIPRSMPATNYQSPATPTAEKRNPPPKQHRNK